MADTKSPLDPKPGTASASTLLPEGVTMEALIAAYNREQARKAPSAELCDPALQWRLLVPHTWPGDLLLLEGTIVGAGTPYPLYEGFDSLAVEPADAPPQPKAGVPGQGGRTR